MTTLLGIVGAIVASWLGQHIGWYGPDQSAGFIGAIVGAVIILAVYRAFFSGPAAQPPLRSEIGPLITLAAARFGRPERGRGPRSFAERAQACHDLVVLNFYGRAAVFTDYESALMRALGIAARDKRIEVSTWWISWWAITKSSAR